MKGKIGVEQYQEEGFLTMDREEEKWLKLVSEP